MGGRAAQIALREPHCGSINEVISPQKTMTPSKTPHLVSLGKADRFRECLDALACSALPLKGAEIDSFTSRDGILLTRYYRLKIDELDETPWVLIMQRLDRVCALVNDEEPAFQTPEEAFFALRQNCRARVLNAHIVPAF